MARPWCGRSGQAPQLGRDDRLFSETAREDLALSRAVGESRLESLARDIAPFGASIGQLANGGLVVTLTAEAHSTPLDLAVRAGRCGLKVKHGRPRSSLGISLGHAISDEALRTEHLIASAERLVSQQDAGSIHVSDEIKRLLDTRFELAVEPDGSARLLFEKGLREAPRTVCGKEIPCLGCALGEVAPEKMTWLLDHAQGNPFYLEELVRAAASGSDLSQIPDTVLGTVQIRFDAVGGGSKLVLRAASIFGQSFAAAGVKALLGEMSDEDVDRWLEILVDKEILFCRQKGNSDEHVFRHALLHQAAYAMLAPKEEVSGHYLAGHFLEEQGERDAMVLADHFEKGDKPERAIRWLRVAANQAMAVDDLAAAFDRIERGVRLGAGGDDLAELKVVESEARYWRGDYVLAERAARDGRQCADPKLALRAMTALTDALGMQAKFEEVEQLGLALEERPPQPELLNAWIECKAGLASYLAVGGHPEARKRMLALFEQERDKLDPVRIGRAESMKGHVAKAEGRPAEAVEHIRRAREYFDKAGHRRAGIEALGNHGIQLMELGLLEDAEAAIRSLSATAERMGLNHLFGGVFYMLSNILAYRGCLDEAREFGEKALAWTAKMNDGHFRRFVQLYLVVIENLATNHQRAEEHARVAIEMVAADPSLLPFARALLARALLGQDRVAEAVPQASEAYAQLEARGSVQDGEATIRLAFVECLAASSDMAAAARLAHQAADKIRKQADTIDNPEWRNSFLTRIPEHRRILELEQQLNNC